MKKYPYVAVLNPVNLEYLMVLFTEPGVGLVIASKCEYTVYKVYHALNEDCFIATGAKSLTIHNLP